MTAIYSNVTANQNIFLRILFGSFGKHNIITFRNDQQIQYISYEFLAGRRSEGDVNVDDNLSSNGRATADRALELCSGEQNS